MCIKPQRVNNSVCELFFDLQELRGCEIQCAKILGAERWNGLFFFRGSEWAWWSGLVTLLCDGVRGHFRQHLISCKLEQVPREFLACSLCCWQQSQCPDCLPPSALWTWKAPRRWLCRAMRAGRGPITLMCLFMFAHCWEAHRLVSQGHTQQYTSEEAMPAAVMVGAVIIVTGNIMNINIQREYASEKLFIGFRQ